MTRGDIEIETSTRGGFMKGLRRSPGGESFFVNDFLSGSGGHVGVAATLPVDMTTVALDGSIPLLVQSGSWCASDPTADVDSTWGRGKSFFSGEGLILLRCAGPGDLLLASYGAIVAAFRGPGRLWLQTRSSNDLVGWIRQVNPQRSGSSQGVVPRRWGVTCRGR